MKNGLSILFVLPLTVGLLSGCADDYGAAYIVPAQSAPVQAGAAPTMSKLPADVTYTDGGGLEDYAPGKCIGGDIFGNREGLLPEGKYHECDVGTLGRDNRGAERVVWDEDGNIYYTADHYESFELLYVGE